MLFTGSFFNFHVIYRLPFLISMLFSGSLFSIFILFTSSLSQFTCYSQVPFFNLHVLYRLPFPIFILFTGSLFQFTCYLHASFLDFHVIYRFPFLIYMLFKVFWQSLCLKFTKKSYFTRNLQAIYSICRNSLHVIYMILALCFKQFTVFSPSFTCLTWKFTCCLERQKHVKEENHVNYSLRSLLDYLHVNYMLFIYSVNFQLFPWISVFRYKLIKNGFAGPKKDSRTFEKRDVCKLCENFFSSPNSNFCCNTLFWHWITKN